VEFYNRKEIKDVLAYLRVIANPSDEISLARVVNVPTRGIGDSSVRLAETFAVGAGISLWEAMARAKEISGISSRAANAMGSFVRMIESFRKGRDGALGSMKALMEDVIKRSGIEQMLRKVDPNEEEQLANVEELVSAAAEYDKENPEGSLDEYLSQISLVSDADHMAGAGGAVTLMTLHAAKGLEFPVVAMIGMEEGCLPHARAQNDGDQLEEERRLCFVGITRAQDRLILSKAARRMIRGLSGATVASQFLAQMPKEMLRVVNMAEDVHDAPAMGHDDFGGEFQIGQAVRHPTLGVGKIVDMSNAGTNTRVIVEFRSSGRKTLILEYARLEAVSM
jgi:DNA helicase-2/ATP-dependent DNA helicase PcrA